MNGRRQTLGRWVHMRFYKHDVRLKRTRDVILHKERKKTVEGRNLRKTK